MTSYTREDLLDLYHTRPLNRNIRRSIFSHRLFRPISALRRESPSCKRVEGSSCDTSFGQGYDNKQITADANQLIINSCLDTGFLADYSSPISSAPSPSAPNTTTPSPAPPSHRSDASRASLTLGWLNVRSLASKTQEVLNVVDERSLDAPVLCETWHHSPDDLALRRSSPQATPASRQFDRRVRAMAVSRCYFESNTNVQGCLYHRLPLSKVYVFGLGRVATLSYCSRFIALDLSASPGYFSMSSRLFLNHSSISGVQW